MKVKASKLGTTPNNIVDAVRKAVELSCSAKFSYATLADRVRRRMEEQDRTPWNCVVAKDFLVNVRYAKCAAVLCTIDSAQLKVLVFKAARDDAPPSTAEADEGTDQSEKPVQDDGNHDSSDELAQRPTTRFRILQSNITDAQEEDSIIGCVDDAMTTTHDLTDTLKLAKANLTAKYPGTWQIVISTNSEVAVSVPSVRSLVIRAKSTYLAIWQSSHDAFYEPPLLAPWLEAVTSRRLLFVLGSLLFMGHLYMRMTADECCVEHTEDKPLPDKCVDVAPNCTPEAKIAAENQQWWSRNLLFAMMIVFGLNLVLKFTQRKQAAPKKSKQK